MTTSPIILLCTVGGSHEPILTALRQTTPDFTCFICTDRDPATGRPGSDAQILGKEKCIKARPGDDKPSLSNIPTQAGLREDQYEVVHVPADDLDEVFRILRDTIQHLGQRFPGARLLADYTGGTKTMTAGLVSATLESEGVELQLVTGSRADLIKVRSGMEAVTQANVERVRLERAMRPVCGGMATLCLRGSAAGTGGAAPTARPGFGGPFGDAARFEPGAGCLGPV